MLGATRLMTRWKTFGFEEGLKVFKQMRNGNFELIMRSELAHVARQSGKIVEARQIYRDTLRNWQNMGNRGAIANQLECFGFLALLHEEPERAAKLLGASEALRERIQAPMTDYEQIEYEQYRARLRCMLTDREHNGLWAEGRSMTMEQAIGLALEDF